MVLVSATKLWSFVKQPQETGRVGMPAGDAGWDAAVTVAVTVAVLVMRRAAVFISRGCLTIYHDPCNLGQLECSVEEFWRPEIQISRAVSPQRCGGGDPLQASLRASRAPGLLPWLLHASFSSSSVCPPMVSSAHLHIVFLLCVSDRVSTPPFLEGRCHIELGPPLLI